LRSLLRVLPNDADRAAFLDILKRLGSNLGARITHPRWTSYGALEVDVFASEQDLGLFKAAIEPLARVEFAKNLDEAPPSQAKEETIKEAIRYFNAERYWECHEALEPVWRSSDGREKLLVQAIILVCAAQVHEQRGETQVALDIYDRALPQLSWDRGSYYGIDIERLRNSIELSLKERRAPPLRI
jgi:hypothetical protein